MANTNERDGSDSCNNGMELASEHNIQPRSIARRHSQQEQKANEPNQLLPNQQAVNQFMPLMGT
jgi:hypothetical protein